ncbi:MAG TPA: sulfite exporter TauE/SafE family protein [Salinarimonas sp.]|nr:sulfite exporter TauE/SafE family protein [Salinarimonas sp.]
MADLLAAVDPSDPRIAFTIAITALAGFVRGFTGFGAGMIMIPAIGATYDPVTAIILLFIVDAGATTPMLLPHFRNCRWAEVGPVALAASAAFPLGLAFLLSTDPVIVRWMLSLFVLAVTVLLAAGWRYRGEPGIGRSLAVGGGMGALSGAIGLGGPLIVLFWLGGPERAARVRSNIFAFFGLFSVVSFLGFWWNGLFTPARTLAGLALLPLYAGLVLVGSRLFDRSSDETYRRAALALCGLIAVASMPVWR